MAVFPFILKKYYVSFLPNLRGGCKPNSQKVKIVANEVFEFFCPLLGLFKPVIPMGSTARLRKSYQSELTLDYF